MALMEKKNNVKVSSSDNYCRVLDEISEVLGERSYVTAEDIEQLQYMEQVYISVRSFTDNHLNS